MWAANCTPRAPREDYRRQACWQFHPPARFFPDVLPRVAAQPALPESTSDTTRDIDSRHHAPVRGTEPATGGGLNSPSMLVGGPGTNGRSKRMARAKVGQRRYRWENALGAGGPRNATTFRG